MVTSVQISRAGATPFADDEPHVSGHIDAGCRIS